MSKAPLVIANDNPLVLEQVAAIGIWQSFALSCPAARGRSVMGIEIASTARSSER